MNGWIQTKKMSDTMHDLSITGLLQEAYTTFYATLFLSKKGIYKICYGIEQHHKAISKDRLVMFQQETINYFAYVVSIQTRR